MSGYALEAQQEMWDAIVASDAARAAHNAIVAELARRANNGEA